MRDILTAGQRGLEEDKKKQLLKYKLKLGLHDINAMVLKISAKIFPIPWH